MPTHGIEKETYVNADAHTTKALTFDLISYQTELLEHLKKCHDDHLSICDKRFKGIEGRQKRDTVASAGSGFLGGFAAMAAYWLKEIFK
jgi:hypothetical protein